MGCLRLGRWQIRLAGEDPELWQETTRQSKSRRQRSRHHLVLSTNGQFNR